MAAFWLPMNTTSSGVENDMSDDDEYEIPLQDQRVFGAGIKRKRVKFVPSSTESSTAPRSASTSKQPIGDLYLSLVLPNQSKQSKPSPALGESVPHGDSNSAESQVQTHVCEVCKLPLTLQEEADALSAETDSDQPTPKSRPHEASLAHQVCLTHSHPPSYLDRKRKGLAYLSAYGWDPDSRLGLGATGQGRQYPIKTKEKNDKLGIGVVVPKDKDLEKMRKVKEVKLDAGKVRKLAEKDRKRTERLQEMFYRNEDVERYLGNGS